MALRKRCRGSAMLEFVLSGIPLFFGWLSVEEMSRGMWYYHTLQYAVKMTGSYIAVHGATCAVSPNSCTIRIQNVVSVMKQNAIGLPAGSLNVTFTSASGTNKTCNPLSSCSSDTTQWPPTAG